MARAKWCGAEVYAAAGKFKDVCLQGDGSLFQPGTAVWTADDLRDLEARVGIPDLGGGTFIEKLEGQLAGLSPEEIQLGAEMLYILLLSELDTGGAKKREHVSTILGMLPAQVEIPPDLDAALDAGGVANFAAAKSNRDAHMRFLSRLVARIKAMREEERDALLNAPWDVRDVVEEVRTSTDGMEANAVLHLLYPETFEYMVSPGHRAKLIETFAAAPGVAEAENPDRKIARVRELASVGGGPDFDLYEDPFQRIWKEPVNPRWTEAITWSRRLFEREDFDENERTFKLEVGATVATAREALLAGDPAWLERLRAAFTHSRNNLTSWRAHDSLLRWCEADPGRAREVVGLLWGSGSDEEPSLRAFLEALPSGAVAGPGTRISIASFLLLGESTARFPFYKSTVHSALRKVLGLSGAPSLEIDPESVYRPGQMAARLGLDERRIRMFLREAYPRDEAEHGSDWYLTHEQAQRVIDEFVGEIDPTAGDATYADWTYLLEELRLRMLAGGRPLRDLLDAQGIAWWLVRGPIPEDWTDEHRAAFEAFRAGASARRAPGDEAGASSFEGPVLPSVSAELATSLHLPEGWLQRLFGLLEEKKQLILYGPPGTGKTFIAQHVGRHIEDHGGSTRLVQFHPSYTYEDFFEGYRPRAQDGGALSFDLVPGALREIARQAAARPEAPHLLVIDEINRGNIAKIFGELYFLLEYRDQAIQLQYSRDEPFRLPTNLYVLGTMNTADRSIALVDSALRRRFYFLGLIPTREPVRRVLRDWLAAHDLAPEPADLLDKLNATIDDEDFSIGPSYFMNRDGSTPDLERIWAHAIMPLLEERYYGSGRNLEAEFGLAAVRKRVEAAADATEPEVDGDAG